MDIFSEMALSLRPCHGDFSHPAQFYTNRADLNSCRASLYASSASATIVPFPKFSSVDSPRVTSPGAGGLTVPSLGTASKVRSYSLSVVSWDRIGGVQRDRGYQANYSIEMAKMKLLSFKAAVVKAAVVSRCYYCPSKLLVRTVIVRCHINGLEMYHGISVSSSLCSI